MKTILHYSNRPYSQNAGGTEVFLTNLINNTKVDFTHLLFGERITRVIADKTKIKFFEFANYHGNVKGSSDRIKQVFYFPFTVIFSLVQILTHFHTFQRADIISYSTGSRNSLINFAPIISLIFPKKRQIYIHHGSVPSARFYHNKFFKLIFLWGWNRVENIFISDSQKQSFLDYGIKNGQIIYNTVDIKPQTVERKNQIPRFLYLGRMIEEKGVIEIIDALKILDNQGIAMEFDFVGDGDLVQSIKALKLKTIKISSWPHQDPSKFYQKADCFVFPSHTEGFGLTLIEAMSYGLPGICTNIPTLKEISDLSLFVDLNSPDQIAKQAKIFISKKDFYNSETFQNQLITIVKNKYNPAIQIQEYKDFYNQN